MVDLKERLENLEVTVERLMMRVNELESKNEEKEEKENTEWKTNSVSDYMIKVVYPGIFKYIDNPTAGFPKNRRKVAEQLQSGQYMFMYATSPEKRIIGLTKVTSNVKIVDGRWPYSVDLNWVIGPKQGISFADVGLEIRPRVGDTLYGITDEKAQEIIQALEQQPDLDNATLKYLADKYKDL
jgi:hypothetical protein